jgi:TolB-like protein
MFCSNGKQRTLATLFLPPRAYRGTRLCAGRRGFVPLLMGLVLLVSLGCSGGPRYFRAGPSQFESHATIAVLPLLNLSRYEQAEEIVMQAVIVELLDASFPCAFHGGKRHRHFEVLDPGLVETVILEKRLRFTDRLSLEQLRETGERLSVRYVLVGTVNEFDFVTDRNEKLPSVSISLRIITCANGRIVWAATHSKRGDDAETVFGLGRVGTLEQLAAKTVREMTETLRP